MTRVVQNDGYRTKFGKLVVMAMKIVGLVVYNIAWAEVYIPPYTKWHLDPSNR